MQKLTRAEEQMMQVLWQLDKAFLKEIMEAYPQPKPKQSTVSTVLRILEEKGFVAHHTYGKAHQYYPLVSKEAYARYYFGSFLNNYFDGSFKKLLHFFHKEGDISMQELDDLMGEDAGDR
ncbi:MAG: BlaI/MecI/CopY family transcriptional regulator [Bacteroidetes bacterium]|nr:MAG: BlaI/MecI/CopY family transcriptional regulator [Bacteroidota bacterium]